MPYLKLTLIGLGLLLLQNCSNSPNIDSFDALQWREDANGCQSLRLGQLEILMGKQDQLLGWSEGQITAYLGTPDYKELYIRNQKFLVYYLEPPHDCGTMGKDNPLRLYLRMDALGDSREVSLKNQ